MKIHDKQLFFCLPPSGTQHIAKKVWPSEDGMYNLDYDTNRINAHFQLCICLYCCTKQDHIVKRAVVSGSTSIQLVLTAEPNGWTLTKSSSTSVDLRREA